MLVKFGTRTIFSVDRANFDKLFRRNWKNWYTVTYITSIVRIWNTDGVISSYHGEGTALMCSLLPHVLVSSFSAASKVELFIGVTTATSATVNLDKIQYERLG